MQYRFAHIGINSDNAERAHAVAETLNEIFGLDILEGSKSFFLSKEIEVMKEQYLGKMGHIAIATEDIDLAIKDLESRGYILKRETQNKNCEGETKSIYLDQEVGGFAIHLLKIV